jgi:hypothetical protein
MSLPTGQYKVALLKARRIKGKQLMVIELVLIDTGERETVIAFMRDLKTILPNAGMGLCATNFEWLQKNENVPVVMADLEYSTQHTSTRLTKTRSTGTRTKCDVKLIEAARDFAEF